MKSFFCVLAALVMSACLFATAIEAEEGLSLEVADAATCMDVVDRAPVDSGTSFSASIGKLYCFTRIMGAQAPTMVTHAWYFGEKERARVALRVGSARWRTKSSKIIQSSEIGSWHVDVIGPNGDVLETLQFTITP